MPAEKGIYIEFTPAKLLGINIPYKLHSYLVYRDGKGNAEVIRGGFPLDAFFGGDIPVESGVPLSKSKDKYEQDDTPKSRHSTKLDLGGRNPEDVWKGMAAEARRIGKAEIDYDNSSSDPKFHKQNNNSVVRAVLKKAGVDAKKAIPPQIKRSQIPGYENDLSDPYDKWDDKNSGKAGAKKVEKKSLLPDTAKPKDRSDVTQGDKALKGASAADKVAQAPEGRKFISELTKPDHPAEEILLKSPKTWTRDEMIQVKKRQYGLPANDPRGKDMDRRLGQWFSHVYTDKPVKHDATGRMIEPKPVNPPPKKPLPLRDADGLDLKAGLRRIGARTLAAAKDSGMGDAVKSLQGGLNKLERWRQAESNSKRETSNPPLKEDGVLGPKTKTALKRTLATRGTTQAENAQALGGFHNYVEAGRKGGFKDLAKTVDKSFRPLFRDQAKPKAAKEPHHESLALQNTVNHYGEKQFGRDKWKPVTDDGWIGPKTMDAFAKVAKAVNPERLTRRFGRYLGFI